MLELRSPDDDPKFRDALLAALQVVSPVVSVTYDANRPRYGVWIVVGKKPYSNP